MNSVVHIGTREIVRRGMPGGSRWPDTAHERPTAAKHIRICEVRDGSRGARCELHSKDADQNGHAG